MPTTANAQILGLTAAQQALCKAMLLFERCLVELLSFFMCFSSCFYCAGYRLEFYLSPSNFYDAG